MFTSPRVKKNVTKDNEVNMSAREKDKTQKIRNLFKVAMDSRVKKSHLLFDNNCSPQAPTYKSPKPSHNTSAGTNRSLRPS